MPLGVEQPVGGQEREGAHRPRPAHVLAGAGQLARSVRRARRCAARLFKLLEVGQVVLDPVAMAAAAVPQLLLVRRVATGPRCSCCLRSHRGHVQAAAIRCNHVASLGHGQRRGWHHAVIGDDGGVDRPMGQSHEGAERQPQRARRPNVRIAARAHRRCSPPALNPSMPTRDALTPKRRAWYRTKPSARCVSIRGASTHGSRDDIHGVRYLSVKVVMPTACASQRAASPLSCGPSHLNAPPEATTMAVSPVPAVVNAGM
mmetsp:Transcript_9076/g.28736  ORF Transcript_9076/g.28736 Transcript_9076/m.28736 type:complete len:259 (-) Transcript_9076:232-1008(-)